MCLASCSYVRLNIPNITKGEFLPLNRNSKDVYIFEDNSSLRILNYYVNGGDKLF
jgi:hypothetical protein